MTPEEQLEHERFIARILEVRTPKKEKASRLETWLGSSVVAALVGVIGTGLLGAWVSGLIQDRSRNNELQRTSQQQKLEEQNAAVTRILTLVAGYSSAIDDLLTIVHNSYADGRFSGEELKTLTGWKQRVRNAHDEADSTWRRDKITAGYTLLYVFDSDDELARAWSDLARAADNFEECATTWYSEHATVGTDDRPDEICAHERQRVADALSRFTATAAAKRVSAPAVT